MKRYDRTWPTEIAAIGFGALVGSLLLSASPTFERTSHGVPERAPVEHTELRPATKLRVVERSSEVPEPLRLQTEVLLEMLRRSDHELLRMQAATELGTRAADAERVTGALMIALHSDASALVRIRAAEALARLDSDAALDPLAVAMRSDSEPEVREMAARGLGRLARPGSTRPLVDVLFTDGSEDVRVQAALSLGLVGTGDAKGALGTASRTDVSETVRRAALQALGIIEQTND